MKRIILSLSVAFTLCFILMPGLLAQEKKTEKRVKIITVDENGKKVVIDTVLTGDIDLEDLDLPAGIKIFEKDKRGVIIKGEKAKNIFVTVDEKGDIMSDEDEDILHIKKGKVMVIEKDDDDDHEFIQYIIADGDTIKKKARIYSDKHKSYAWVSAVDDLDDDETEITIRSAHEEEVIKIKGDAVIRIVDGKVKVEAGEAAREVEREIIKKKKK